MVEREGAVQMKPVIHSEQRRTIVLSGKARTVFRLLALAAKHRGNTTLKEMVR